MIGIEVNTVSSMISVRQIGRLLIVLGLILLALVIVIPLLWMVLTGLKSNRELFLSPWRFPSVLKFENYSAAWKAGIGVYFRNSVIVTLLATVTSTLLSCLAAFPLSRITFKAKKWIILLILGGLMLAPQSSVISIFSMTKWLGIYNTHFGLMLVNAAFRIPFSTFLVMTFYKSISYSLDESAYIDGAKPRQVFWQIIMPLSKPIIASVIIVCIRTVWNELMFANVLVEDNALKTIPVGLVNLQGFTTTNWTMLVAGMVITSVPLVTAFLILQKQFIRGLTAGSVKG